VARYLASAGVAPGDRVAVLGANSPEWVAAVVGVIKAGAALVPLNPRLTPPELNKLIAEAFGFRPPGDQLADRGPSLQKCRHYVDHQP
jgi:acyl-CoA synthetase (AMP-forming)/AMP-acid ligase II